MEECAGGGKYVRGNARLGVLMQNIVKNPQCVDCEGRISVYSRSCWWIGHEFLGIYRAILLCCWSVFRGYIVQNCEYLSIIQGESRLTAAVPVFDLFWAGLITNNEERLRFSHESAVGHFLARTNTQKTSHMASLLCICAGRENRTPVSTLARSHSTTKPCPHADVHMTIADNQYFFKSFSLFRDVDKACFKVSLGILLSTVLIFWWNTCVYVCITVDNPVYSVYKGHKKTLKMSFMHSIPSLIPSYAQYWCAWISECSVYWPYNFATPGLVPWFVLVGLLCADPVSLPDTPLPFCETFTLRAKMSIPSKNVT